MHYTLWILGILILFYVVHKILMNWQVNRTIDKLFDDAQSIDEIPELKQSQNILQDRLKLLNENIFANQDDLLYELSRVHIMNKLKDESGWAFDRNEFKIKRNLKEINVRLRVRKLSYQPRIYQLKYKVGSEDILKVQNYELTLSLLDAFFYPDDLDKFYS